MPISNTDIFSTAQRIAMAQEMMQLVQSNPQVHGPDGIYESYRRMYAAIGVDNVDQLLVPPQPTEPAPVEAGIENNMLLMGQPAQAFPQQNHDAHIQIKTMFLQDPANGANPMMQRVSPVLQANIQEHIVMKYEEQVNGVTRQMMSQAPQGDPNAQDPKVIEQVMVQAAQQVMSANQAMAQQGGSPEQQMVQIEGQRLNIEKEKIQAQVAKEASEGALKNRDLDLKEQQIALDAYKIGAENLLKADENDRERNSKQAMNAVKVLAALIKKGDDIESAETIKTSDALIKMLQDAKKEGQNVSRRNK